MAADLCGCGRALCDLGGGGPPRALLLHAAGALRRGISKKTGAGPPSLPKTDERRLTAMPAAKPRKLALSARAFWLCLALLVCLRCALTAFQQAYTWVGGAPLDDELMFRAANAVTAGEWLGPYDYLTLS